MSFAGNLSTLSPEFLAYLALMEPKKAPKDEDGIDEADDASEGNGG